jgi:uncharacterized membrane protein YdjX (TVP38/TMEM64 family)
LRSGQGWRLLFALAAILAVVVLARALDLPSRLLDALAMVPGMGPWGPLLFIGLYIATSLLFLPGWMLTLGAGFVFGIAKGMVTVSIGATLGAASAFLVGRYLARDAVARRLEAFPSFRAIDEAVARDGWKIVGLARMSPLFPFNVMNYAFGLTRIPFGHYVLASWIGMLPGTFVYVYFGSIAGDLATLGQFNGPRGPMEWAFYAIGLAATVVVTVFVTRLARAALARHIDD